MIKITCTLCQLPVVEAEGQFQKLDSYYLDEDGPLDDSVGYWHTSCLTSSPYGAAWHDLRLKNHTAVRGYQIVERTNEWSVIRHPRTGEQLALSTKGDFLSLEFPRRIRHAAQGSIYLVEEPEYNLHLEDAAIIQAIQESLKSTGTFPVLALFEALEIADRVSHPEALEGSLIHFSRPLVRNWAKHSVAARWEYGVFIPSELEPYVSRGSRSI
jgi:hypothetical protein